MNRPVYPTSHLQTRLHPLFRNFKHLLLNLLNKSGTLLQIRLVAHLHTLLQAFFLSLRRNPFRLSLRKKARFTPCTKKKKKCHQRKEHKTEIILEFLKLYVRRGGLVISALDSRSKGMSSKPVLVIALGLRPPYVVAFSSFSESLTFCLKSKEGTS